MFILRKILAAKSPIIVNCNIQFSYRLLLVIVLIGITSAKSIYANDKWGDYEISDENTLSLQNAIRLAAGVLEEPESIAPMLRQNCEEQQAAEETRAQLCSEENIDAVNEIITSSNDLETAWLEESIGLLPPPSQNWQDRFQDCNRNIDEKKQAIQDYTDWVKTISKNPPKSRSKFNKMFRERFASDFTPSTEDMSSLSQWCKGKSTPPTSNLMPILLTRTMLDNFGKKQMISDFCHALLRMENSADTSENEKTEMIKDFFITTAVESDLLNYSYDQIKKGQLNEASILRQAKYMIYTTVNNSVFNSSMTSRSIPDELIKEQISDMTNGNCEDSDIYYQNDENGRYCACYVSSIEDSYAKVAEKKSMEKKQDLQSLLSDMYSEMIKKSGLSDKDQEKILKEYPTPPVELISNDGWNGFYAKKSTIPPFNPGLLITPGMIENFNHPKYRDYIMGTLTHELGHHVFSSIYDAKNFNSLSDESQGQLEDFNNCVDQTTIKREVIPGLRGKLISPSCTHVASKRSELGADLFSSVVNSTYANGEYSWDRVKSSSYLCTIAQGEQKISDTEVRERYFKIASHTEPISRAQIYLDPPPCSDDFWSN